MAKKKSIYRKKKRYAVIVQMQRQKPYKWRFNSLERLDRFLNSKYPSWRFYDLYDNKTKEFIKRVLNPNWKQRRYKCGVKVDELLYYWHTDDLLDFVANFLDQQHSSWKWFNVYDSTTGTQLANFTTYNRPLRSTL